MSAQEREGFGVVLPANPDIEGIKAAARAEQALADMVESHPESDTRTAFDQIAALEAIEAGDRLAAAAVEYLDPINQFTHSREKALRDAIREFVAASEKAPDEDAHPESDTRPYDAPMTETVITESDTRGPTRPDLSCPKCGVTSHDNPDTLATDWTHRCDTRFTAALAALPDRFAVLPASPDLSIDREGSSTMSGPDLIAAERARQISEEGYDAAHDRDHADELAQAAAAYAIAAYRAGADEDSPTMHRLRVTATPPHWPWANEYWKPVPGDRIRELVKAGALIAAAIDSLAAIRGTTQPEPTE